MIAASLVLIAEQAAETQLSQQRSRGRKTFVYFQ
jgi:hypothetical protein